MEKSQYQLSHVSAVDSRLGSAQRCQVSIVTQFVNLPVREEVVCTIRVKEPSVQC